MVNLKLNIVPNPLSYAALISNKFLGKQYEEEFTVKLAITFKICAIHSIPVRINAVHGSQGVTFPSLILAIARIVGTTQLLECPYYVLLTDFKSYGRATD